MTYRDWDKVQSKASYKRRWQKAVGTLARAQYENRIHTECLEIAMEALNWYGHNCPVLLCGKAGETLDKIEQCLAELESEEETG